MKGVRKYTHEDRQKVIEEMIPLIKKKFGDNMIALASLASFARGDDADYSDLELVAYLKKMPEGNEPKGMSKIRDGLLVELEWTTKEEEIKNTHEVTGDWYIAGSDIQKAIINEELIKEINDYIPKDLKDKCLIRAARLWYEVQEATCKVLNAIAQNNSEGISLLVFDMFLQMLKEVSFLNQTPYVTYSTYISQAKGFKLRPGTFDELIEMMESGSYTDLASLKRIVEKVYTEFEVIFEDLGFDLYYDNVDPNLPHKDYRFD
ncbi:MAG: hypothetical protein GY839_19075 [candidate division Zixibacteria bacterium]|nr:hypothetical protein [candidate division Zixibacteria bacterium]